MIRVDVRRKAFGPAEVLRDVVFSVAPAERLAILGPSGVGKSTLLRLIAGLDTQFEGRIDRPGTLSFMFQEPTLLPWRTVGQNLSLTTRQDDDAVARILDEVGLAGRDAAFPRQLSLGQQRRVALARALLVDPDLLILDEPFTSLDRALLSEMLELTREMTERRQVALLLVTHNPDEAAALSARVLRLVGSPATLTRE